jgi:hypothetical protein
LLAQFKVIHTQVKAEYGWPGVSKELRTRGLRVGTIDNVACAVKACFQWKFVAGI